MWHSLFIDLRVRWYREESFFLGLIRFVVLVPCKLTTGLIHELDRHVIQVLKGISPFSNPSDCEPLTKHWRQMWKSYCPSPDMTIEPDLLAVNPC